MKVNTLRWSVGRVSLLVVMAGLQAQGAPGDVLRRDPVLMAPTSAVPVAVEAESVATVEPVAAPVERALPTMTIADLNLADTVDVVVLLRLMAKMADVNMLISPSVKGTVGFSFRGIPWDQAFRSIVTSAGLTYVWQGDVLRVMTIEDVRSELEMETILRDRESVREDLRRVEPMVMQVISLRYLVAESVGKMITQMLSSGAEPGADASLLRRKATVSVNNEANAIIVHASRDDVEKAMQLVAKLDRPQPLVQIEAKIVEAGRDTARQLGLQWGGRSARLSDGRMITASSGSATAGGFASDFPAQFASDSTKASAGFSLGLVADRVGMNELLNLQLTALQRQGRINIQASPTVTTLDNEMALIESGEERAYRVSTGSGTVQEGTLEWKKAVLRLEVTPHVVDGRKLRVKISSNKDSFDETKPQTNNEFPVSTKSAQTTVFLADGETTMIGGFSIESSSESTTGVPFLMHIPLLGYLFKSKSTSGRFDETIIFITPTIL